MNLEIPSDHTKFPFIRTAAICCNLVSPKVQDEYARFLGPEQINKLKTKALRPTIEQIEEALVKCWTDVTVKFNVGRVDRPAGYKVFGAFAARCVLFVLGNGSQGSEGIEYENLDN